MKTMTIRTYSDLILLPTFEERFDYLDLNGIVGERTFGSRRYLNQILYTTDRWKETRRNVIIRDNGCDLGIKDREIMFAITVHHMNPITIEDILNEDPKVYDMEFLITTADSTHRAIHYSNKNILQSAPVERTPFDTCPWRK